MHTRPDVFLFLGLAGLIMACQPDKKTASSAEAGPAPVATLPQSSYRLGDSIEVTLTRPARPVGVDLGGRSVPFTQPSDNRLVVRADTAKVGRYLLVIWGREAHNAPFSDTLLVDLRSDVTPVERPCTVLKSYPHQTSSFTEGLEFYRGDLYEGTGLNGQSQLMRVNLTTGQPLQTLSLSNR